MAMSDSLPLRVLEESFPSVTGQGRDLIESVLCQLSEWDWSPRDRFAVNLAMEEAFTNAVEHGNHYIARKHFHVRCEMCPDRILVSVRDEGKGFRCARLPDPRNEANLETPSGRGVVLINGFMSRVWHNEEGNEIFMEKIRSAET